MNTEREKNRVYFIDYLRGLLVLYVVFDHSMHPYSPHFKKMHYFADFGGTLFFDIWHMHNDVIMMPLLYFLAGLFVLSSLKRRGWLSFAKEKFYRLVIPFVLGTAIIVPPQKYISNVLKNNLDQGFFDYWFNTFFFKDIWSSGFWFVYYLAVLTFLLVTIHTLIPTFMKLMGRFATWLVTNPLIGFLSFFIIGALIIGISEMIWGAQYWIGFWKVFYVRSARFIMKAFLFFLGAGFAYAGISKDQEILTRIGNSWKVWVTLAVLSGGAYISYALTNFYDGAYSNEILRHFHFGGTWGDVWPVIQAYGGPIFTRTTLLALFMCSLVVMYVSLFKHFLDKPLPKWQSLAACSFGIYIFHEPIVLWVGSLFYHADISEYIKFTVVASVGAILSWALTHLIKDWSGFKKVL